MRTVNCPKCSHTFQASDCCATSLLSDNNGRKNGSVNTTTNIADRYGVTSTTTSFNFAHLDAEQVNGDALLFIDASSAFAGDQQVTISTQYGIQSGGCLIQNRSSEDINLRPKLKVSSTLSGGRCMVQKMPSEETNCKLLEEEFFLEQPPKLQKSLSRSALMSYGNANTIRVKALFHEEDDASETGSSSSSSSSNISPEYKPKRKSCVCRCCRYCRCHYNFNRNSDDEDTLTATTKTSNCCSTSDSCQKHRPDRSSTKKQTNRPKWNMETDNNSDDVCIELNAKVLLPSTASGCSFKIKAKATKTTSATSPGTREDAGSSDLPFTNTRPKNNLNGGGIIHHFDDADEGVMLFDNYCSTGTICLEEPPVQQPSEPVSWVANCPWGVVNFPSTSFMLEKDFAKLQDIRRTMLNSGWYYESLTWEKSENMLRDAPLGHWLLRDSSDNRYEFAVSVQTARGPTSVRVLYFMGKFRLDAEPRLALTMPLFDCPVKMIEYYVEYSKKLDEEKREVLVDYNGKVHSLIYLSVPVIKEVRSLAHLARLAVNRAGLEKEKERLPPLIKNYIAEYPYSF